MHDVVLDVFVSTMGSCLADIAQQLALVQGNCRRYYQLEHRVQDKCAIANKTFSLQARGSQLLKRQLGNEIIPNKASEQDCHRPHKTTRPAAKCAPLPCQKTHLGGSAYVAEIWWDHPLHRTLVPLVHTLIPSVFHWTSFNLLAHLVRKLCSLPKGGPCSPIHIPLAKAIGT
jgi:hypothetical protein